MRPYLLKVLQNPSSSFNMRQDKVPYMNNRWHYHAEAELIHFKKGKGTQFIGDHIQNFQEGDVVLVGPNLPHYWRFDDIYFKDDSQICADVRGAHFCEDFWGSTFLKLPENKTIQSVLERSRRGIIIHGKSKEKVAAILEEMLSVTGSRKIILLMEALLIIAESTTSTLASIGFNNDFKEVESDRIKRHL